MHALEPDPLVGLDFGGPSAVRNDMVREDVADQVARWSEKYPRVSHTVAFRSDNAVEAILHQLGPDDLVIVGGRRHSPVMGRIRYSVADAVLRRAPCPVIVVHEQGWPR